MAESLRSFNIENEPSLNELSDDVAYPDSPFSGMSPEMIDIVSGTDGNISEPNGEITDIASPEEESATITVIDPGITLVKRRGSTNRRVNKAALRRRRKAFEAERRRAAITEMATVDEEMLEDDYLSFSEKYGRRPAEDDILSKFRSAQAAQKAKRVIGDFEKFGKKVDEDKAWSDYYADGKIDSNEKEELDALPAPEKELPTIYEKKPASWTRDDIVAIYSAFSKYNGHWLSARELQELCQTGTIPAQYKTFIGMFEGIEQLATESRQAAVWYQAKREREANSLEPATESKVETSSTEPVREFASEMAQTDSRGEMYTRLVSAKHLPRVPGSFKGSKTELTIIDDTTIELYGKRIELKDHKLYAFNALLLNRDEASSPEELADHGFDPRAKISELKSAIRSINTLLKRASRGDELIGTWTNGRRSLFILSPSITVTDSRHIRSIITNNETTRSKNNLPPKSSFGDEIAVEFDTNNERVQAVRAVVKQFGQHPQVIANVEALKSNPLPMRVGENEVQAYFRLMGQFSVLDQAEERELFRLVEEGLSVYQKLPNFSEATPQEKEALINLTTAQQLLFLSNLRLVISIARPFAAHKMLPFIDLIQEGNVGLSKAISLFDYTMGYKFSTYATWWIRQSISRAMADRGRIIRMPVHAHVAWIKLNQDIRVLEQTLEREPTEQEIARYTKLPLQKVRLLREMGVKTLYSIDQLLQPSSDDNTTTTLADVIPDPKADMDRFIDRLSAQLEIRRLFGSQGLSDRDKLILGLRYGTYDSIPPDLEIRRPGSNRKIQYVGRIARLNTTKGRTLEQIGSILGITRERVRVLESEALDKSRIIIEDHYRLRHKPFKTA